MPARRLGEHEASGCAWPGRDLRRLGEGHVADLPDLATGLWARTSRAGSSGQAGPPIPGVMYCPDDGRARLQSTGYYHWRPVAEALKTLPVTVVGTPGSGRGQRACSGHRLMPLPVGHRGGCGAAPGMARLPGAGRR
jgi:hypothetical protein